MEYPKEFYSFGHRDESAWNLFNELHTQTPEELKAWVRYARDHSVLAFVDCLFASSGKLSDVNDADLKKQEIMTMTGRMIQARDEKNAFLYDLGNLLIVSSDFLDRANLSRNLEESLRNGGEFSGELIRRIMTVPMMFDTDTPEGELTLKYLIFKPVVKLLDQKDQSVWRNLYWDALELHYMDGLENSAETA